MNTLDVHDTRRCPIREVCDGCDLGVADQVIVTVLTPVGVACAALCPCCADRGAHPSLPLRRAVYRFLEHEEHTGRAAGDAA